MRSYLFIPGDSPKKLDKGMGSGADALLLDLEDSISPQNKAQARATTLAFLKEAQGTKGRPRLYVRINGLATGLTDDDLDSIVSGHPDMPIFVFNPHDVEAIIDYLESIQDVPSPPSEQPEQIEQ